MAADQEKDDSVYDFLYIDSRRIALFLSQFDSYGHLKALTRSTSENSKTGGGIDIKVAKVDYSEGADSSIKKEYDAQWIAPLVFLDEASKRDLIERDISKARVGRLVLLSGRLSMFDLGMLKGAWEMPVIRRKIQEGVAGAPPANRQQRRSGGGTSPQMAPELEMMLGFLGMWPHVTQVTLAGGDTTAWGTIRDDSLLAPASDLALKHGVAVDGTWNIVGILDAMPDSASTNQAEPTASSLVGTLLETIAPLTKQFLGRPSAAYGVTPLLIFRDVSA